MKFNHTRHILFLFAASAALLAAAAVPEPGSVVDNYQAVSAQQQRALDGSSMEIHIEASLPKLKKQGVLQGLRHISRVGRVTYEALHFEGDNSVKNHVIARYLSAEAEAQAGGGADLAVTPANYKFKYKSEQQADGRTVEVFQVTPRRKHPGLFKGEIWIDPQTYLCVHESGRLVKPPSIFLKRIDFVKDFAIQSGISVPREIHSIVETRLVGPAELTIQYRNVSLADTPQRASLVDVGDQ